MAVEPPQNSVSDPSGHQADHQGVIPYAVDHAPMADGLVRVTLVIPGWGRTIISIPYAEWLNGAHHTAGTLARTFLATMLPPTIPDDPAETYDDIG